MTLGRILSIVLILSLAGCMSRGSEQISNETMATVSAKVVKGQTTQAQIRQMYGEPTMVTPSPDGGEAWNYSYSHAGFGVSTKQVLFVFDKNGVVQNFTVNAFQQ